MCMPRYGISRKLIVAGASVIIVATFGWWYAIWAPHLNETYGYGDHFTTGCPLFSMGWDEIKANLSDVLRSVFLKPMKYLGLLVLIGSIVYVLIKKKWTVFALFFIPYICFLIIILKTGKSVAIDQYYVLCAIPSIAFIAGYGLSQIRDKRVMYALLIAIAAENVGDQVYDFRPHKMNMAFADLENIVDKISDRNDLFVINSSPHCPTVMYFAHRRGWTVMPATLKDQSFMNDIKSKGCKFVIVCKEMFRENFDVTLDLPLVYQKDDYKIYSLTGDARP